MNKSRSVLVQTLVKVSPKKRLDAFIAELRDLHLIPAGRILYGAGFKI